MLDLFRRPGDPPEYAWLYAIPAALFAAGLIWAWQTGEAGLTQAGYVASTFLCIGALTGLSAQVSFEKRANSNIRRPRAPVTCLAFSACSSVC